LTKSQTKRLEAVQRRAINIIFVTPLLPPIFTFLALAGISPLQATTNLPTEFEVSNSAHYKDEKGLKCGKWGGSG